MSRIDALNSDDSENDSGSETDGHEDEVRILLDSVGFMETGNYYVSEWDFSFNLEGFYCIFF